MARRLGLLGGSFDPIHLGHLLIAEEARAALALDRVLFVPARRSPFKPAPPEASDPDRVAMIEAAIADQPAFALHRAELERPAPSYTIDTLRTLHAAPGEAPELWLILGSDALAGFGGWREADAILALARLAVFERRGPLSGTPSRPASPDAGAGDPKRKGTATGPPPSAPTPPGLEERVDRLDAPLVGISSTDLRRRLHSGRTVRYQVPAPVEALIHARGLYGIAAPAVGRGDS